MAVTEGLFICIFLESLSGKQKLSEVNTIVLYYLGLASQKTAYLALNRFAV